MVLYHWARCSTCRQVRDQLAARGVVPTERDFFAEPLSSVELQTLARAAGGLRPLASTASPSFRKRGRPLDEWSDAELEAAMVEEPRLLRRPLLQLGDGTLLIGAPAIRQGVAA